MRSLQIGIIGSSGGLKYSKAAVEFTSELGRLIAERKLTLVYGAEKDANSLPTIAAMAAVDAGGSTLGITYGKKKEIFARKAATSLVVTGLVRGGGRETTLVLSCDVLIAIAGGSGTLNEICIAYQSDIPVIAVDSFGGWSQKLANTYLDARKRYKIPSASSPDEAIRKAVTLVQSKKGNS